MLLIGCKDLVENTMKDVQYSELVLVKIGCSNLEKLTKPIHYQHSVLHKLHTTQFGGIFSYSSAERTPLLSQLSSEDCEKHYFKNERTLVRFS